jgi:aminotransferase EvaB
MIVPMFDLGRKIARFESAINNSFAEVLGSGRLILGDQVMGFEKEFAEFLGVDFFIGVANGTDAIEIALKALQLEPGGSVLTVANAGGYAVTSIINSGLTPKFLDIDRNSGLTTLELCMNENLDGVVAVVLTHLFGNPIRDLVEISSYFKSRGVYVVEDCAQAHGAKIGDKYVGTFSDLSCFSFYPTKNLGCLGDGGGISTNNFELSKRLFKLRTYGWSDKYLVEVSLGRNSRLDEIQAGFLRLFLQELISDNNKRASIAEHYLRAIAVENVRLIRPTPDCTSSHHLFPILTKHRSDFVTHLANRGVSSAIHYPIPDTMQLGFKLPPTSLANTEVFSKEVVSIPLFPEMLDSEIRHVVESVNSFSS